MRYFLPVLLALSAAVPSYAADDGSASLQTVKDAATAAQADKSSPVLLEGFIISKAGDELYIFQDASGDVLVEIDDDIMADRSISPEDAVRLKGYVDSEDGKNSVEVDTIEVLD